MRLREGAHVQICRERANSGARTNAGPAGRSIRGRRWPELDGLRGVAILLVFLRHYIADSRSHEGNFGLLYSFSQVFRLGWSGVDLFFILSGFLIGGILLDTRSSSNYFRTFYIRRVHRILPVYYVWIMICSIGAWAIMKWGGPEIVADGAGFFRPVIYVLFLQNILSMPVSAFSKYLVSPTWSLAVEEQFYLVAPLLVRYLSLRRLTQMLLACVLGAPVLRFFTYLLLPSGADKSVTLMPCRADALAMGMLAAIAWRTPARDWLLRRKGLLKAIFGILLAGALAMTKWLPTPRNATEAALQYSWIALLYSTVLLIVLLDGRSLMARVARWPFLRECGRVSYCFYLIHLGVLGVCHWIFGIPYPPGAPHGLAPQRAADQRDEGEAAAKRRGSPRDQVAERMAPDEGTGTGRGDDRVDEKRHPGGRDMDVDDAHALALLIVGRRDTIPAKILACRAGSDRRLGLDVVWANRDKSWDEVVAALQETVLGKKGQARRFLTWAMELRSEYELPLIGLPNGGARTRGQTRAFDLDEVFRLLDFALHEARIKGPRGQVKGQPKRWLCEFLATGVQSGMTPERQIKSVEPIHESQGVGVARQNGFEGLGGK